MASIAVVVTPKSGKNEVVGWRGSELSVRVAVAPEGGKANLAVCKTLADALGVPKTSIKVARGETARHKIVEIDGMSDDDVHAVLGAPDKPMI
jgi:uncharacterized protein